MKKNVKNLNPKMYVENIGRNKFRIFDSTYNVDISIPPYNVSFNELQNSINTNRDKLRPLLSELERLIETKISIKDGRVQALIKSLLTRAVIINSLISVIQLKGGDAKLLPLESEIVEVLNVIISGMKRIWIKNLKEELKEKERNLNNCKKDLRSAMGFKAFRNKKKKKEDVYISNVNLAAAQKEINHLRIYLDSIK